MTIPYWLIRFGLPAGFLLLATVAILVARQAIHAEETANALPPPPPPPARVVTQRPAVRSPRTSDYAVRSGDTLGTIAARLDTTVDELLALNPGIDPRALRVGQTLRVE